MTLDGMYLLDEIHGSVRIAERQCSRNRLAHSSHTASTNSLRVVMLICLVTLCCSRRTIRRVANYVRQ